MRYRYELRTEGSAVILEEWGAGREVAPGRVEWLLLRDTWRSAATIDYAYESKALQVLEPPRRGTFAGQPAVTITSGRLAPRFLRRNAWNSMVKAVGWQGRQPRIVDRSTDGEVIERLKRRVTDSKYLMDRVIEKASDSGCAHACRLRL